MLTIQQLKETKPNTIFAKGQGLIIHPWFNNEPENLVNERGESDKQGKYVKVNWVATRGGIYDWAIYHSLDANLEPTDYLGGFTHLEVDDERIYRGGAKIRREEEIKKFVPCDDEAFKMYRF
jgi:hypothetical protein